MKSYLGLLLVGLVFAQVTQVPPQGFTSSQGGTTYSYSTSGLAQNSGNIGAQNGSFSQTISTSSSIPPITIFLTPGSTNRILLSPSILDNNGVPVPLTGFNFTYIISNLPQWGSYSAENRTITFNPSSSFNTMVPITIAYSDFRNNRQTLTVNLAPLSFSNQKTYDFVVLDPSYLVQNTQTIAFPTFTGSIGIGGSSNMLSLQSSQAYLINSGAMPWTTRVQLVRPGGVSVASSSSVSGMSSTNTNPNINTNNAGGSINNGNGITGAIYSSQTTQSTVSSSGYPSSNNGDPNSGSSSGYPSGYSSGYPQGFNSGDPNSGNVIVSYSGNSVSSNSYQPPAAVGTVLPIVYQFPINNQNTVPPQFLLNGSNTGSSSQTIVQTTNTPYTIQNPNLNSVISVNSPLPTVNQISSLGLVNSTTTTTTTSGSSTNLGSAPPTINTNNSPILISQQTLPYNVQNNIPVQNNNVIVQNPNIQNQVNGIYNQTTTTTTTTVNPPQVVPQTQFVVTNPIIQNLPQNGFANQTTTVTTVTSNQTVPNGQQIFVPTNLQNQNQATTVVTTSPTNQTTTTYTNPVVTQPFIQTNQPATTTTTIYSGQNGISSTPIPTANVPLLTQGQSQPIGSFVNQTTTTVTSNNIRNPIGTNTANGPNLSALLASVGLTIPTNLLNTSTFQTTTSTTPVTVSPTATFNNPSTSSTTFNPVFTSPLTTTSTYNSSTTTTSPISSFPISQPSFLYSSGSNSGSNLNLPAPPVFNLTPPTVVQGTQPNSVSPTVTFVNGPQNTPSTLPYSFPVGTLPANFTSNTNTINSGFNTLRINPRSPSNGLNPNLITQLNSPVRTN